MKKKKDIAGQAKKNWAALTRVAPSPRSGGRGQNPPSFSWSGSAPVRRRKSR